MANLNSLGFLRALLSRRDWVYSLSLLIPFVIYNLSLKVLGIASLPGDEHGLAQILSLMWSAIFFNVGYALLWIGLFAAVRKGPLRRVVVFLFHTVTILVVIASTSAYQYLQETGAALEYGTIAEWIPKLDEIEPTLLQGVALSVWILLAAALFYMTLGPLLLTRAVERWRGRPGSFSPREAPRRRTSFLGSLRLWLLTIGLFLLALSFGWLSVLSGTTALARDPLINVVLTGVGEVTTETEVEEATTGVEEATTETEGVEEANTEEDKSDAVPVAEHATLTQTSQTGKRNVVLVHLESTRAQSVTPYNEDLSTTPFLNELAKSSLLAEQPHVGGAPRSTLSNISVNCGIPPPPRLGAGYHPGEVPVPCLAGLLKDQGYSTVFFSSNMDSFGDLATNNFGYQEAFAPPSPYTPTQYWDMTMDTQKYVQMSSFNYEEDIMLKPSEKWLKEHKDKPFVAEYLTGTGHYDYQCLNTRYGSKDFSENDLLNHYLNCMRLLDTFVKNLIDQYKELGLYDDTIFVIFGDHGEGLGEHGRFLHGDTIWEESLRVPLIIQAPGWFENSERVEGLASHIDVLPTVVEMLGYEVKDGKYPGYSLLHPLPSDRTLRFRCVSPHKCLASIKGNEKYIYHYNNQPEEVFNLSEDPLEKHNLADEYSKEELDRRREDLFAWFSRINAHYGYSGVGPAGEETGLQAKHSGGQPPESTMAVGQPLRVGDVEWTVTSAYPADQLVSFYGETKRGNFIVVDFQLKNNSNDGLELSPESLALFDGDGGKYKFDTDTFLYIDSPKLIFLSDVGPGDSQEGQVIFKVPPDASQFQLQLGERNPFSNKKGYVNLGF